MIKTWRSGKEHVDTCRKKRPSVTATGEHEGEEHREEHSMPETEQLSLKKNRDIHHEGKIQSGITSRQVSRCGQDNTQPHCIAQNLREQS